MVIFGRGVWPGRRVLSDCEPPVSSGSPPHLLFFPVAMTELARRFCFRPRPRWWPAVLVLLLSGLGPGCAPPAADPDKIRCDGSSTVFPITEAVVEEFARTHPAVKVTVGASSHPVSRLAKSGWWSQTALSV